uniref:Plastocyanin-like domain-containing protein n=1 Tax=Aegilops tauschii subsp. strangulata TaxID=200361 RepID=A0A452YJ20_AEGTS
GSFFYFPSTGLQRAAGGFGGIVVNNRGVIAVPFGRPDGDITILIGDWYNRNHTDLRKMLDEGKELGMPDGVLINGKGPYRYNDSLVPAGIEHETIDVHPGNSSHPGAQRGHVDEPQLPDPGAQPAAGGDGGVLHHAAELHQPRRPRRPVLLLPPHHRPERQLRLLCRRQRPHRQRVPLAARHRRRRPPLLQLRRRGVRPAPGPAPGPVRQDALHEPGAVRPVEPQRGRGAAQPAGLLPLLLDQRDAGVPAAEHHARGDRRAAQGGAERAVLLPAGDAAAAGRRVRRGGRLHARLPGAAAAGRRPPGGAVRHQRHLPGVHGAHLPEQRHPDAELPRGRVRRVRRRDGLRGVDGGQPGRVQQGGQRGAQHRAGVPRRVDGGAGVAGQRGVLERAVAEPRLVVPRPGGIRQGGEPRGRRQQDRDGRPPQRPLLRPAPQVPEVRPPNRDPSSAASAAAVRPLASRRQIVASVMLVVGALVFAS